MRRFAPVASLGALLVACVTSPLGRSQLILFPEAEMDRMGVVAFDQLKNKTPVSRDARASACVRCVADAITRALPPESGGRRSWEVVVFEDDSANAFALPGSKIGVHTGLLKLTENQDRLATVIGHEVAHVLAKHSNERASNTAMAQTGLQAVSTLGDPASAGHKMLMAALGLGAEVGVLMPFGRTQESEADMLGLDLMASAGFDPRESVPLWQKMMKSSGSGPPEFLSTHPSPANRIAALQGRIPRTVQLQSQAHAAGRRPRCEQVRKTAWRKLGVSFSSGGPVSEITILLPHGEVDGRHAVRAARLQSLRGKRIGFLDNGLWRSMRILGDEFSRALTETCGISRSEVADSGPLHGADPKDYRERLQGLAARVDAVVSGLGN